MRYSISPSIRFFILLSTAAAASGCGATPGDQAGDDTIESQDEPIIGGTAIDVATRRSLGLVNPLGRVPRLAHRF